MRTSSAASCASTEVSVETPGQQVVRATEEKEPGAGPAPATKSTRRTHSEALRDYWRDVKAGRRTRKETPREIPKDPDGNPLLDLPDAERSKLFVLLRECPHTETVNLLLQERGVPPVTTPQLDEFFREEACHHWEVRTSRAASEADALVRLAEKSVPKFSTAILTALGQEAFRQIASGNADPGSMSRLATLFMKARGDKRADTMQELKRRKLLGELEDELAQSFARLAEEVQRHPAAQEAFDTLRRELAEHAEENE